MRSDIQIPLPKGWPNRIRSGVIHVISLAHFSLTFARSVAANNINARIPLKAENSRLRREIAILVEEARIKDSGRGCIPAQRSGFRKGPLFLPARSGCFSGLASGRRSIYPVMLAAIEREVRQGSCDRRHGFSIIMLAVNSTNNERSNAGDETGGGPRRTRRRRFVHRVGALILAALVCELLLQLLTLVPSPRLRALREPALAKRLLDPKLGHRGNPVWREYDESGFRNAVRPETVAIVAIGDSQTESQSVSRKNAWPQQVELITGRSTYNMGLAGFGPAHYYALTDEALALSPELILVALYAGNDFADAYLRVYEGDAAPELRAESPQAFEEASRAEPPTAELDQEWHRAQQAADPSYRDWKHTISEFAKARFQLFALARTLYRSILVRVKLDRDNRPARWSAMQARAEATDDDVLFAIEVGAITTILTPTSSLSLLNRESDPRIAEGWQVTLRAIRAMSERIGNQADLVVLFIPTKELVYTTWLRTATVDQTYPAALERLVVIESELWRDTATALDDVGVEHLDLLPALIGCLESGEWPYNNDDDGHPIVCGNRAMAQAVADALSTAASGN